MLRDRTVIRHGLKYGSFRRSALSHVEPGDGAADDQALDLAGALEDGDVAGLALSFHPGLGRCSAPDVKVLLTWDSEDV